MEGMVRLDMGPAPDDLELLIQSVKQTDPKNVVKGKGVGITESKVKAYKIGKHKVEEGMKFEVVGKSLVEDRAEKADIVTSKNWVGDRAKGLDGVAGKSLDIFVRSLRGTPKNLEIIKSVETLGGAIKSEITTVKR